MQAQIVSQLPKLGSRNYIQGGTIFNGMLAAFDQHCGMAWSAAARVDSFKLEHEAFGNGRIVIADTPLSTEGANAVWIGRNAAGPLYATFTDEGAAAPSVAYDEESFYEVVQLQGELSGEFRLPASRSRQDFLPGLIGANKLLHQKLSRFPGGLARVQFLYLRDLDLQCIEANGQPCTLSISNLMTQRRGDELWTINRIRLHSGSLTSEFRLCYRGAIPAA